MSVVRVKASAAHRKCLEGVALDFKAYLRVHPIPFLEDCEVTLLPARTKDGRRFAWQWNVRISDDVARATWQGICDSWLRKRHATFPSLDVACILIQIDDHSADEGTAQDCAVEGSLFKGEGLASFHSTIPRYELSDLILPESTIQAISDTLSIIRNQDLIYNQWGFSAVDPLPRAVLNFYGPSGTGKTMAAHAVANQLGKSIMVANFAQIESKYVGDSPKNLENLFQVAKDESAVLFFDEADSFLGKRLTSISSSSDQSVNSLRSQLLQLLEEHEGLVIFCTNLLRNYDKAFDSRILCNIKFELPDEVCRERLIRRMIPAKIPLDAACRLDEDAIRRLAGIADGFSGREIKNAILRILCAGAVRSERIFRFSDFEDGFRSAVRERDMVRNARGGLDAAHASGIGEKIAEKLKKGDFVETKERKKYESQ